MIGQHNAEFFLQNKGYQTLERNYRIKTGEIDLIVTIDNYIVFVEVKFRRNLTHGFPCEAVNAKKQHRIIKTAEHYITIRQLVDKDFRFDVVEILEQNGQMYAKHIENAFEA